MPVIVKISNQRRIDSHPVQLLAYSGHRLRRLRRVDRDSDQLSARLRYFLYLDCTRNGVDVVRVGHRLNTDRPSAANDHASLAPADFNRPADAASGRAA